MLTPLLKPNDERAAQLPHASTLCGACTDVCPVRIPLHELLLGLRSRTESRHFSVWSRLWSRPAGYRVSVRLTSTRFVPVRCYPRRAGSEHGQRASAAEGAQMSVMGVAFRNPGTASTGSSTRGLPWAARRRLCPPPTLPLLLLAGVTARPTHLPRSHRARSCGPQQQSPRPAVWSSTARPPATAPAACCRRGLRSSSTRRRS